MNRAVKHLIAADPALAPWIARIGTPEPLVPRFAQPYEALFSAVAHQQLHGNAARAMLGRLQALTGDAMPTPEALLALPDGALRACGFSANKALALRDIAAQAANGTILTAAAAARLSDAALIERLVAVRGVGRWTVEMLLIFSLRRPDVFPVDDFGVREGYRVAHGLEAQPKPKALALQAEAYAPYRSTAALYFWRIADFGKLKPPAKVSVKVPAKVSVTPPKE